MGWIRKFGLLRMLALLLLAALMAGVIGPCFSRVFVPNDVLASTQEPYVPEYVPYPLTWILMAVLAVQFVLLLPRRAVTDVLAAVSGVPAFLWMLFPEVGLTVMVNSGGLGGYAHTRTLLGYGMLILCGAVLAAELALAIRQLHNSHRSHEAHRSDRKLRTIAAALLVLALAGSFGPCIKETAVCLAEYQDMELGGWTEYHTFLEQASWLVVLLGAALVLVLICRRWSLIGAAVCCGLVLVIFQLHILDCWFGPTIMGGLYDIDYRLTLLGGCVAALNAAAGGVSLLLVERLGHAPRPNT